MGGYQSDHDRPEGSASFDSHTSNAVSGHGFIGNIVQAQVIYGGVHFYATEASKSGNDAEARHDIGRCRSGVPLTARAFDCLDRIERAIGPIDSRGVDLRYLIGEIAEIESILHEVARKPELDHYTAELLFHRCAEVVARAEVRIPDMISLHYLLAQACNMSGFYRDALMHGQILIDKTDRPQAAHLFVTGVSLLNMCLFDEAEAVFSCVAKITEEEEAPPFAAPPDEEARLKLQTNSDIYRLLWIPHYKGDLVTPMIYGAKLIKQARELDSNHAHHVLHRLGRVQYDQGKATGNRSLISRGLRTISRARKIGGELANAFAPLAQFYPARALGLADHVRYLHEAAEMASSTGETAMAHVLVARSKVALAEGLVYNAIDFADQALATWTIHGYPRGVADALIARCNARCSIGTRSSYVLAAADILVAQQITRNISAPIVPAWNKLLAICLSSIDDSDSIALARSVEDLCARQDVSLMGNKPSLQSERLKSVIGIQ